MSCIITVHLTDGADFRGIFSIPFHPRKKLPDPDTLSFLPYLLADFLPQWVLIAGFVEIGETIEDAAKREVFEETGIRIKNLKYFGSQPWGFSGSVIMGFIAELDGSDTIHLDHKELADAVWHSRFQLPRELTDISITYEMIEALRLNKKEAENEYIRNRNDMQ